MNKDYLETKNLILRKANNNDLESIWNNIWSDNRIAENMLWKVTETFEEAKERLERTIRYQENNYAYLVCFKLTNEPIGFAGIFEKEKNIYEDTGICIATNYQGNGYGKEIVFALKKLIFEILNGDRFIYGCFNTNEKSRRVCLSQGFKYLNSKKMTREWDNKEFEVDYYYFDKDMYYID